MPIRVLIFEDNVSFQVVYAGGAPMSPSIARKVIQTFPTRSEQSAQLDQLTSRESQVLPYLAQGMRYKLVAAELGINLETVRTHIDHGCSWWANNVTSALPNWLCGDSSLVDRNPTTPI